MNRNELNWTVR